MTDYKKLVEALRYCDAGFMHECDNCLYLNNDDCMEMMLRDAAAAIEALQAELIRICKQLPKRGEWELIDEAEPMRWGCSRCKYLSWETSNYCPRCGAEMEVQDG